MSNNYDEYDYDEKEKDDSGLLKKLLVIVLIIIAILIILFLIRGCNGTGNNSEIDKPNPVVKEFTYESALIEAAKKYYQNNNEEMPKSVGECTKLDLEVMVAKGLIDPSKFEACNSTNTYVRLCLLPNGRYQYTPWLTCNDRNSDSEYTALADGTIDDIIADETYVEFRFLPQVYKASGYELGPVEELLKSEITYPSYKTLGTKTEYRYKDKLFTWNVTTKKYYTSKGEKNSASDVKEYYPVQPSSKYPNSDSRTTEAYKWYIGEKEYFINPANGAKDFSPTAPEGYPYNEGGVKVTLYQSRSVLSGRHEPYKYYVCALNSSSKTYIYQQKPCGESLMSDYTYQKDIVYSCRSTFDGNDSVMDYIVPQNTDCANYSEWSKWTTTKCNISDKYTCKSKTVTMYNWYKYKEGTYRYYNSGSTNVNDEKVYYVSAPAEGYQPDKKTRTTAYKWYSTTTKATTDYTAVAPKGYSSATKTDNYKWTEWSSWSTTNPKTSDGRTRTIETRTKIKLQQIIGTSSDGKWTNVGDYMTEEEMLKVLQNLKYDVHSLEDINNNGEIRYETKLLLRNKLEVIK